MKALLKVFTLAALMFGLSTIPSAQARVSFGVFVDTPHVSYGVNNYRYYPRYYRPYYYSHGYYHGYPYGYRPVVRVVLPVNRGYSHKRYHHNRYKTRKYGHHARHTCRVYSHKRFHYGKVHGNRCYVKHHWGLKKYKRFRVMR